MSFWKPAPTPTDRLPGPNNVVLVPTDGVEPPTNRLQSGRSTVELSRQDEEQMSKRPTYGDAIGWLIANEELDWIDSGEPAPHTVEMASELFAVSIPQIGRDIRATLNSAKVTKRKPKGK
jgi:hypothetical protein